MLLFVLSICSDPESLIACWCRLEAPLVLVVSGSSSKFASPFNISVPYLLTPLKTNLSLIGGEANGVLLAWTKCWRLRWWRASSSSFLSLITLSFWSITCVIPPPFAWGFKCILNFWKHRRRFAAFCIVHTASAFVFFFSIELGFLVGEWGVCHFCSELVVSCLLACSLHAWAGILPVVGCPPYIGLVWSVFVFVWVICWILGCAHDLPQQFFWLLKNLSNGTHVKNVLMYYFISGVHMDSHCWLCNGKRFRCYSYCSH